MLLTAIKLDSVTIESVIDTIEHVIHVTDRIVSEDTNQGGSPSILGQTDPGGSNHPLTPDQPHWWAGLCSGLGG